MAQILDELQSKYVPTNSGNGNDGEILQRVIFDGDQLTEERARNCQWANILAESEMECLDGITPAFADWHLKKVLLGVNNNFLIIIHSSYHQNIFQNRICFIIIIQAFFSLPLA